MRMLRERGFLSAGSASRARVLLVLQGGGRVGECSGSKRWCFGCGALQVREKDNVYEAYALQITTHAPYDIAKRDSGGTPKVTHTFIFRHSELSFLSALYRNEISSRKE